MINIKRPAPFIIMSSNHGTMIVNRNDYQMTDPDSGYGVGFQLLNTSCFDQEEIDSALMLLNQRRRYFGDGVIAIDCGANVGVHTIEWARLMHGWGEVISFEAQEKIFYALAGNVAINNCLNVTVRNYAIGAEPGAIDIPELNYLQPSSYGSLELRQSAHNEYIGQDIDYANTKSVPLVPIDSLGLNRLDFIKIDVEGMEVEVLKGAENAIKAHKPVMMIEVIKSDQREIESFLAREGYRVYPMDINILAVHASDPIVNNLKLENGTLSFAA